MTWILPTRVPKFKTGNVITHIVMKEPKTNTGGSTKVFYRGRQYKSKAALASRYKVTRKVIDRWIFEGKVITL